MAEYSIYNSQWTAQQIEASIGKNPRIGESGNWEVWDVASMSWIDTGVAPSGGAVIPATEKLLKGNGAGGVEAADYLISGRNLLDNPWFTVNQRGITSGQTITNAYCFDRWRVSNILTLSIDDDVITLTPNGTYQGEFAQRLEQNLIRSLVGKTVTFSAWLKGHGYFIGYGTQEFNYSDWTLFTRVLPITTDSWIGIGVRTYDANSVVQIKGGVKLELGSVSTLANDTEPNYETELAKCQKYYNCLGKTSAYNAVIPFSVNGAGATFAMLLPFQMRDGATTVKVKGTLYLKGSTGGLGTISFSGTESWTVAQNKPFLVCWTSKAATGGIGGVAAADNLELSVSADL